jgi:hypothetical protein
MKQHRNLMTHAWTVTAMLILATASRLLAQVPGYTATTVGNLVGGYGIGLDTNGNLYICYGNLIQKISTTGTASTVAGGGQNTGGLIGDGGPATSATLSYPIGVAVDSAGNLYIAEYAGNRIRKVSTIGTITTVTGPGSTNGALGDGGPATSATLSGPRGVAVDSAGNVYIADSGHARVRKVSLDGTIANRLRQRSAQYSSRANRPDNHYVSIGVPSVFPIDRGSGHLCRPGPGCGWSVPVQCDCPEAERRRQRAFDLYAGRCVWRAGSVDSSGVAEQEDSRPRAKYKRSLSTWGEPERAMNTLVE